MCSSVVDGHHSPLDLISSFYRERIRSCVLLSVLLSNDCRLDPHTSIILQDNFILLEVNVLEHKSQFLRSSVPSHFEFALLTTCALRHSLNTTFHSSHLELKKCLQPLRRKPSKVWPLQKSSHSSLMALPKTLASFCGCSSLDTLYWQGALSSLGNLADKMAPARRLVRVERQRCSVGFYGECLAANEQSKSMCNPVVSPHLHKIQ